MHQHHLGRLPRRSHGRALSPVLIAALMLSGSSASATGQASGAAAMVTGLSSSHCTQPGPYQLPHGKEPVDLDPDDFTIRIDNPWWPMKPGTSWRYVERGGGETGRVTTTVTHRTKRIAGVRARVVHDVARMDGQVIEDTMDWYAQDAGGSIWYLGELSRQYEDGVLVSTAGSWTHGKDGAQAGVIVPARPRVGCSYREEYHAPDAKDRAQVLSTSEGVQGPTGYYRRTLHTANSTPVEPRALENKFYGYGVGPILELDLSPQLGTSVLVRVSGG